MVLEGEAEIILASEMIFDFFLDFGGVKIVVSIGVHDQWIAFGVQFVKDCRKPNDMGHFVNLTYEIGTPTNSSYWKPTWSNLRKGLFQLIIPQMGLLLDSRKAQGVDLAMYTLSGEF